MTASAADEPKDAFEHVALVFRSEDELVAQVVPFLREGVRRGEPVTVNLTADRLEVLARAMGPDAARVRWTDTTRWAPHPGRRLRAIGDAVADGLRGGVPAMRFVGECPYLATPAELTAEWSRFDAALNDTFAGLPLTMVCAYDGSRLPAAVVDDALAAHPTVGVDPRAPSPGFVDPDRFLRRRQPADLAVPPSADRLAGLVTPGQARRFLQRCLDEAGAGAEQADDLAVVVSEVITNAWQAGASAVTVSCWTTPTSVVVQVDDDGPGLWDALAGYRRPAADAVSGRGLWITRQLADVVELCPRPSGTSVRVQMLHPGSAGPGPARCPGPPS